ncbi:hypothetical protein B0H34DRAFT_675146 [Crassisporium funariophilum]|nr:hypothetical protein B0H34DRAFT_675146 [Crassisporium funariophilum]
MWYNNGIKSESPSCTSTFQRVRAPSDISDDDHVPKCGKRAGLGAIIRLCWIKGSLPLIPLAIGGTTPRATRPGQWCITHAPISYRRTTYRAPTYAAQLEILKECNVMENALCIPHSCFPNAQLYTGACIHNVDSVHQD